MRLEFNVSVSNFSSDNTTIDADGMTVIPKWCEVVLLLYMYITAILAICGNCVILLVETNNRYKTSTDWLVSFMSCNDILFAVFCIPMYIIIHMGYWSVIASDAICKIFRFVEYVTMFTSAMLLGTVAFDRYFKTCRPHTYFLSPTRAFRCCTAISTTACVLNLSTFGIVIYDGGETCGFRELAGGLLIGLLMTVFIGSYIAMFIMVGFCYIKVAYTIKTKLFDHSFKLSVDTPGKEKNAADGRTTKILSMHKGNKVAPSMDIQEASYGEPKKKGAVPELKYRLFDQSSDSPDNQNSNSKTKEISYSASCPKQGTSFTIPPIAKENGSSQKMHAFDTRVDRTTKIMFAVTLVFVLSWIPTWSSYFYNSIFKRHATFTGDVIMFFLKKSYMINTFMNPIFYIWMSSAFKEKTRQTLRKICSSCGRKK